MNLDNVPMTGAELRLARQAHGLSIQQLAAHLQVDERTVRRWEASSHRVPGGVASEVRGLADLAEQSHARWVQDWEEATDCGMWNIPDPVDEDTLPPWGVMVPLPILRAALWRAHLTHRVRITSPMDTWPLK